jgi:hypothetical protein
LPSGFPSPHAVSAEPVNIIVQEDEFRVALRLPTLPGERYLKPVKITAPRY